MAFASSLFCSSKFLNTNILNKRLTVLACSDNTKEPPFRFRFLAHFTLMLDTFFLRQNIGWWCWAHLFAPPSEWRPRGPPIPPVGKTAPAIMPIVAPPRGQMTLLVSDLLTEYRVHTPSLESMHQRLAEIWPHFPFASVAEFVWL